MKVLKKTFGIVIAIALALSLGVISFAVESTDTNAAGEPVDRSGQVTQIDIPNDDGTFTTLAGEEAKAWYDQAIVEGEQRMAQEVNLKNIKIENEIAPQGAFVISIIILSLSILIMLNGQNRKKRLLERV